MLKREVGIYMLQFGDLMEERDGLKGGEVADAKESLQYTAVAPNHFPAITTSHEPQRRIRLSTMHQRARSGFVL
jgi:hypothetical protein